MQIPTLRRKVEDGKLEPVRASTVVEARLPLPTFRGARTSRRFWSGCNQEDEYVDWWLRYRNMSVSLAELEQAVK